MNEYNQLAQIYDSWCAGDPATQETLRFYTDLCSETTGNVVELGIGNGRIALEIAKQGKHVIGIDISEAMLAQGRARINALGLSHLIQLIQSDMRTFTLSAPADLVILPFRTVGHLLTEEDRLTAFRQIYRQMAPGGRFVFDHFVIRSMTRGQRSHGIPRLMCKNFNEEAGTHDYIWYTYLYGLKDRIIECTITLEQTNLEGTVVRRQHSPLTYCWIEPNQLRSMLSLIGFQIEALYGSFNKDPFDNTSDEQIWVARRP